MTVSGLLPSPGCVMRLTVAARRFAAGKARSGEIQAGVRRCARAIVALPTTRLPV